MQPAINRKPEGFPPVIEVRVPFFPHFVVLYLASVASILTVEKWGWIVEQWTSLEARAQLILAGVSDQMQLLMF